MGKRLKIAKKYIELGFCKLKTFIFCKISKSTYYHFIKPKTDEIIKSIGRPIPGYSKKIDGTKTCDSTIISILKSYRNRLNFQNSGGCKILHHYLKRDHKLIVNYKKIYRLCKKNKLLLPKNKKKIKVNRKLSKNRIINSPNKLWQFDIKTGYIHGENKYFYLLAIIDVFNKKIINYHLGYSCKAKDLKITFEEALLKENIKNLEGLAIRSDNGPQMTSYMFYRYVNDIGLEHEFIPVKTPNKNAFIESFFSIYETQFLQVRYFDSFSEVFEETVEFINYYNHERLHGSIFKLPPVEFTKKFEEGMFSGFEISA